MKIILDAEKVWSKTTDSTGRVSGLPKNIEIIVIIETKIGKEKTRNIKMEEETTEEWNLEE